MGVMERFKDVGPGTEGPISVIELEPFPLEHWRKPAETMKFGRHLVVVALRENADWNEDDFSRTGGPRLYDFLDVDDQAQNQIESELELRLDKKLSRMFDELVVFLFSDNESYSDLPVFREHRKSAWTDLRRQWLLWTYWLFNSSKYNTYRHMPNCTFALREALSCDRLFRPKHNYTVVRLSRECPLEEQLALTNQVVDEMEDVLQQAAKMKLDAAIRDITKAVAEHCQIAANKICSSSGIFHP